MECNYGIFQKKDEKNKQVMQKIIDFVSFISLGWGLVDFGWAIITLAGLDWALCASHIYTVYRSQY
jgi:hypothetical protein